MDGGRDDESKICVVLKQVDRKEGGNDTKLDKRQCGDTHFDLVNAVSTLPSPSFSPGYSLGIGVYMIKLLVTFWSPFPFPLLSFWFFNVCLIDIYTTISLTIKLPPSGIGP